MEKDFQGKKRKNNQNLEGEVAKHQRKNKVSLDLDDEKEISIDDDEIKDYKHYDDRLSPEFLKNEKFNEYYKV